MEHSTKQIYRLIQNYAGVCVKQSKNKFAITDETGSPLVGVKRGTLLAKLTDINPNAKVLSATQEIIPATGTYFITVGTIAPYHIILDILDLSAVKYNGTA